MATRWLQEVYRDRRGQFTTRRKAVKTEVYEWIGFGRTKRAVAITRDTFVQRTALPETVAEEEGSIRGALYRTNALSYASLRGAKHLELWVTGKDRRDQTRRIKASLDLKGRDKNLDDLTLWKILDAIRKRGYRTQYDLETARFTIGTKTASRRREPLSNVTITVKIYK